MANWPTIPTRTLFIIRRRNDDVTLVTGPNTSHRNPYGLLHQHTIYAAKFEWKTPYDRPNKTISTVDCEAMCVVFPSNFAAVLVSMACVWTGNYRVTSSLRQRILCGFVHPCVSYANPPTVTKSQAQSIIHSVGNGLIFTWKTVFKFLQMPSGKRSLHCFKTCQLLHKYPPHLEIILKL